jgi:hypothetical protein
MFNTEGWRHYVADLQGLRDVLRDSAVTDCDTADKWIERRATVLNLDTMLAYQGNSEYELTQLEAYLDGGLEPEDEINLLEL